jgi:hypothetical protein
MWRPGDQSSAGRTGRFNGCQQDMEDCIGASLIIQPSPGMSLISEKPAVNMASRLAVDILGGVSNLGNWGDPVRKRPCAHRRLETAVQTNNFKGPGPLTPVRRSGSYNAIDIVSLCLVFVSLTVLTLSLVLFGLHLGWRFGVVVFCKS